MTRLFFLGCPLKLQTPPIRTIGSGRFGGVTGFFSQKLLGYIRVNDCPAGLEPPAGLEIGEKLL